MSFTNSLQLQKAENGLYTGQISWNGTDFSDHKGLTDGTERIGMERKGLAKESEHIGAERNGF